MKILFAAFIGAAFMFICDVSHEIGNFDGFRRVAEQRYPKEKVVQLSQIGQFVRVDENGDAWSFSVSDLRSQRIYGEKKLFNVREVQGER